MAPTSCNAQGPGNYFRPLSFLWVVVVLFWDIAKHLEEAGWAEMTTELKGIFKEFNNHSAQIYGATAVLQNHARHAESWSLAGRAPDKPASEDRAATPCSPTVLARLWSLVQPV